MAGNTAAAGALGAIDIKMRGEEQNGKTAGEMDRMDVDAASNDTNQPTNGTNSTVAEPRPEAVNLRGVDNLSTAEVLAFATSHFTSPPTIEWIDDTSCNLVYADTNTAGKALDALSVSVDSLVPSTLRIAHPLSTNPDARLQVRIAFQNDKKTHGARDRSRYYLFHGEPMEERRRAKKEERKGERGRTRKEEKGKRSKSRVRRRSANKGLDLFPDRARSASPLRNSFRAEKAPTGHSRRRDEDDLFPGKVSLGNNLPTSKPLEERIGSLPRRKARARAEDLFG